MYTHGMLEPKLELIIADQFFSNRLNTYHYQSIKPWSINANTDAMGISLVLIGIDWYQEVLRRNDQHWSLFICILSCHTKWYQYIRATHQNEIFDLTLLTFFCYFFYWRDYLTAWVVSGWGPKNLKKIWALSHAAQTRLFTLIVVKDKRPSAW